MTQLLISAHSKLSTYSLSGNDIETVNRCVDELEDEKLLERHHPILIFGKQCFPPRFVGFFSAESVGYNYSNQKVKAKKITQNLRNLLELVNVKLESNFNGILINKYQDGNDCIGKHSDDERELTPKGVVSISWGASRKFRIRNKKTGKIKLDYFTQNNEILVMSGDFQKEFTHEIPIEKKVKEMRYSFTFRQHTH